MSSNRKFSDLTKKFTPDDWGEVERIKAEMLATFALEAGKGKKGEQGHS